MIALGEGERLVDVDVGVAPGVILRNTFIRLSSPKATEELLCSPENSADVLSVQFVAGEPVEVQLVAVLRLGGERLQPQRGGLPVVQGVVGVHVAELVVMPVPTYACSSRSCGSG